MKAAILTAIGKFDIVQVSIPEIENDTDVLIKMKTVGVCGSDIHYFTDGRIGSQIVEFPFILGHEAAGIVENIGETVTRVKPGQRIAIDPALFCGKCDQCLSGRENTCRNLLFLGCPKQLEGCLCEYIVLHENCCYPIPDTMSFEQATLSEPLAVALYSVERSSPPPEATIGILGAGTIGMSVFHVLRAKGINKVYITDKIEERLTFSQALKPAWTGNPNRIQVVKEISNHEPLLLDVVYECCGDPDAIKQGIQLLKPGGTLVLIGIPETDTIFLPIHELRRCEITILNIRRQAKCTQKAIDMLAQRLVTMDTMVTHRFPLEKTQQAFNLVSKYQKGVMKAMISIHS